MGWDEMRKSTQKGRSVKPVPWQGAVKRKKKTYIWPLGTKTTGRKERELEARGKDGRKGTWNRTCTHSCQPRRKYNQRKKSIFLTRFPVVGLINSRKSIGQRTRTQGQDDETE